MGKLYFIKDESGNVKFPVTVGDGVVIGDEKLTDVLDEIRAVAETGGVTGVKGSAESAYRKGNVEITAENIGLGNVSNESKATMFASPEFTGTPTAPTAATATDSTQVATTEFVHNVVETLDVSDSEEAGKYVSAVSQTDGKISVTRKALPTQTDYGITVTKKGSPNAGAAASYTIAQSATNTSVDIDIPKDMVVSSGTVVTYTSANLPTGTGAPTAAGTYLVLTLANATNDKVYINVGSLIEYVTSGSKTGDMIVVSVSNDHKVTASITDGTITKAKLNSDLQSAIENANSAIQSVTQGSANGTISVDGTDVSVKGLGSAAYKNVASSVSSTDQGLVTAKQVADMGYTKNVGTITGVTAGNGLTGGGTSGAVTVGMEGITVGSTTGTAVTGTEGAKFIAVTGITTDDYGRVTSIEKTQLTNKYRTYTAATQSAAGLMSAADKTVLDTLDANAVIFVKVSDTEYADADVLKALGVSAA